MTSNNYSGGFVVMQSDSDHESLSDSSQISGVMYQLYFHQKTTNSIIKANKRWRKYNICKNLRDVKRCLKQIVF